MRLATVCGAALTLGLGALTTTASASPPIAIEAYTQIYDSDPDAGLSFTLVTGDIEGYSVTYLGDGAAHLTICYCTVLGIGEPGVDEAWVRLVSPHEGGGTWTVLWGTGELANVHGQGWWYHDLETYAGMMGGKVHIDPAD